VSIRHNVTLATSYTVSSVTFGNNGNPTRSLTITNGTLTVTGNYTHNNVGGGPTTTVNNGANLVVGGTLVTNTNITVNGKLTVSTLNPQAGTFTIGSTGEVIVTNNLNITNGVTNFDVFGSLTVGGSTSISGNNNLNIKSGGEMNVANNFSLTGSGKLSVENGGFLQVGENLSISGGSTINPMNGNINVLKTLSINNPSNKILGDNQGCIYFQDIQCPDFIGSPCDPVSNGLIQGVCIADFPILLPVEWLYFRGTLVGEVAVLEWATAKETNHQKFTIESAADGFRFEPVGIVMGEGDRFVTTTYRFTDPHPVRGNSYYRIRQTDNDGTESFSKIVSVTNLQGISGFVLSPNPALAGQEIWVEGSLQQTGQVGVTIFSLSGQVLFQQNYSQSAGSFRFAIPTAQWSQTLNTNLLIVQYQTGQAVHRQKLVLQ
jgi:hypothetical protein